MFNPCPLTFITKAKPSNFVVREGKTYMSNDEGVMEFEHFTFKLLCQLKHQQFPRAEVSMEVYRVISCRVWVDNKIETGSSMQYAKLLVNRFSAPKGGIGFPLTLQR